VRVRFSDDLLELEVEDRGLGMPALTETRSRGMGLVAMRERAQLLNGKIEFLRPAEGGTLVRLLVPLDGAIPARIGETVTGTPVVTTGI
jgi:signal transduction histidine kinase